MGNKNLQSIGEEADLDQTVTEIKVKLQRPVSAHLGDTQVCLAGRSALVLGLFPKEMTVELKSYKKSIQLAWCKIEERFFSL